MRFFLRLALGLILTVVFLFVSGCASPVSLPPQKNIPSIDLSVRSDEGSRLQQGMERTERRGIAQSTAAADAESNVLPAGDASGSSVVKVAGEEQREKSPESPPEKSPAEHPSAAAKQEAATAFPLPSAVKKLYAVQIVAFQDIAKARKFTEKTRGKLPDIRWARANIKGKGVWYRILVGPFCTKNDAARYREGKGINDLYSGSFIREIALPVQDKPKIKSRGKPQTEPPGKPRRFLGP